MIPLARIDAASSSRPSELKCVLGCIGLGWIRPNGSVPGFIEAGGTGAGAVATAAAAGCPRPGRRAERPLPSALRVLSLALFIRQNLLREFDIALGSPGTRVVHENGFAVTGRFRQSDAARNHSCKYLIAKEIF